MSMVCEDDRKGKTVTMAVTEDDWENTSVASATSVLTRCEKMRLPFADGASAFFAGSYTYVDFIYITVFGANPSITAVLRALIVPYDIISNPYCGWLSDMCWFNKGPFKDLDYWGRRAPMAFAAMPFVMFGGFITWVGPPASMLGAVGVALWFGLAQFLIKTGTTLLWVAETAAFTELMPSRSERQFNAAQRFFCQFVGFIVGSMFVGSRSLGVGEMPRAQQTYMYGIYGVLLGGCWIFNIPFAFLQRKSVYRQPIEGLITPMAFIKMSLMTVVESSSLRWFMACAHFSTACLSMWTTVAPYYFNYVLGYTKAESGEILFLVMAGISVVMLLGTAPVYFLAKRFGSLNVALFGGCLCLCAHGFCHSLVAFVLPGLRHAHVQIIAVLCGASYSFLSVSFGIASKEYLAIIVDEDQVRMKANYQGGDPTWNPPRRDGVFNAVKMIGDICGILETVLFTFVLGPVGFNYKLGQKENQPQPELVKTWITINYNILLPFYFLCFAFCVYMFPLRQDAARRKVKAAHKEIFHALKKQRAQQDDLFKLRSMLNIAEALGPDVGPPDQPLKQAPPGAPIVDPEKGTGATVAGDAPHEAKPDLPQHAAAVGHAEDIVVDVEPAPPEGPKGGAASEPASARAAAPEVAALQQAEALVVLTESMPVELSPNEATSVRLCCMGT